MAGTFLALYLNAKLKPFGDYHTSFWKMVGVVGPVIGAMFVAGSLVADRVGASFLFGVNAYWVDCRYLGPLADVVSFLESSSP